MYGVVIGLAALFSKKARLRYDGGKEALECLRRARGEGDRYVWVHAASLGEFEQGRPFIEKLRVAMPEHKILLTFFSPSGYEVMRNYEGVDVVCYLPMDMPCNVCAFLDILKPEMAVFVKYEYWANFLFELKNRRVSTYIISAIFRKDQVFFKTYGGFFRKVLGCFSRIFVQNEESEVLLHGIGVENVDVVGDTRFDRVANVVQEARCLPVVEAFAVEREVIVAGSTWGADEEMLCEFINENRGRVAMVIAPHEVSSERIEELCGMLKCSFVRYSLIEENKLVGLSEVDCLVVDTIGVLSSVYQYGKVAYIGGGFGVGIHNTLEAAAWGMPVVWGPNYERFQEARDLIGCGGGFSISTYEQVEERLNTLLVNPGQAAQAAKEYVQSKIGAAGRIIEEVMVCRG